MTDLIPGVHLISQNMRHITTGYNFHLSRPAIVLFLIAAVMLAAGIIFAIRLMHEDNAGKSDEASSNFILAAIALILFTAFFAFGLQTAKVPNTVTIPQYTVIVDDTVSFNEFNSHYNVVKQDGDTYIITIKGEE